MRRSGLKKSSAQVGEAANDTVDEVQMKDQITGAKSGAKLGAVGLQNNVFADVGAKNEFFPRPV